MKRFLNIWLVFIFLVNTLSLSYAMKRTLELYPVKLKKKKIDIEGSEESLQNLIDKILVLKKEYPDLKMTIVENSSEQNDFSIEKSDSDHEEHKETIDVAEKVFIEQDKVVKDGKQLSTENTTKQKLACIFSFQQLAIQMSMLPKTEIEKLKECFIQLKTSYKMYRDVVGESFLKTQTEFPFCIGLLAYYLGEERNIDDIKAWFAEINEEMSQYNGIQLIKSSPGEQAYWFMEGLTSEIQNDE